MGTKTVRIPNQCSCSSTVPGKSRGDTDPQTAHHQAVGWACRWPFVSGQGIAHGRAQLEQRMEKGACPQALPSYHHN